MGLVRNAMKKVDNWGGNMVLKRNIFFIKSKELQLQDEEVFKKNFVSGTFFLCLLYSFPQNTFVDFKYSPVL